MGSARQRSHVHAVELLCAAQSAKLLQSPWNGSLLLPDPLRSSTVSCRFCSAVTRSNGPKQGPIVLRNRRQGNGRGSRFPRCRNRIEAPSPGAQRGRRAPQDCAANLWHQISPGEEHICTVRVVPKHYIVGVEVCLGKIQAAEGQAKRAEVRQTCWGRATRRGRAISG